MDIPEKLSNLADASMSKTFAQLDQIDPMQKAVILIEACRAFDYWHVQEVFEGKDKLPAHDFTIISRGWNVLLSQLLPNMRMGKGVPLLKSDKDTIMNATGLLYQLGRAVLIKENAAMVYHGMATAAVQKDGGISVKMSERLKIDHFLDGLEEHKLNDVMKHLHSKNMHEKYRVENLEQRLEAMVFPWETPQGTMIGYDAEPDIDDHFLSLMMETMLDWRNEAGIHPNVEINGVLGADIIAIGSLLISAYLKHIYLVWAGMRKIPNANYFMSMTIWQEKSQRIESISGFTGIDEDRVSQVLDILTVDQSDCEYFKAEFTPFMPLLIKISDDCLIAPVSSIFRNPFNGIRMFHERSGKNAASIRNPREDWMTNELYHIFLGNRYRTPDKQVKLKKNGRVITDIDAAIYDIVNGDLALFQLKWQDFTTNNVKQQRSKAKNFVDQIDNWTYKIDNWIAEFGLAALFQALQIALERPVEEIKVKIFAVGRSKARFQSYGYSPKSESIACATWPQFTRLRYETGPADDVFGTLHQKIKAESAQQLEMRPMPFEMEISGQKIILEDLWCDYDDKNSK